MIKPIGVNYHGQCIDTLMTLHTLVHLQSTHSTNHEVCSIPSWIDEYDEAKLNDIYYRLVKTELQDLDINNHNTRQLVNRVSGRMI